MKTTKTTTGWHIEPLTAAEAEKLNEYVKSVESAILPAFPPATPPEGGWPKAAEPENA